VRLLFGFSGPIGAAGSAAAGASKQLGAAVFTTEPFHFVLDPLLCAELTPKGNGTLYLAARGFK
jgi:flavin-dependent dehydrogenase